jgi:hypothetical protein
MMNRGSNSLLMTRLWALVIVAGLFALGCVWALPPNDLWWHVRIGSDILDNGHIPRHDVYSLTEQGRPFYYQSWLAEVLMVGLMRLGGVRLLVFVRAVIMAGLFGTVMLLCWWAGGRNRWAAILATLGAILLGVSNQTVRPQLFAYPLFITVYALLWRHRRGKGWRSVWLIPALTAIWANVHGSFVLGVGLIWFVVLGEVLSYALPTLGGQPTSTQAEARERLKTLALVALLSTVATLLNPRGIGIAGYVVNLLTDPPSQFFGIEWQPLDPKAGLGIVFYPFLLSVLAALALARPPVALTDLLLVVVFAWLGASGVRYVVWFGLVSAPVLSEALLRLPKEDLARWRDWLLRHPFGWRLVRGDARGYPGFRRIVVVSMVAPLLVAGGFLFFYPDDTLWLTNDTGVASVDFMEEGGLQGRLFNELARGSYLIWRLGPAQPVFIDPRFELYSFEHFEAYRTLSQAEGDVASLLAEYDFALLLLDRKWQAPLAEFVDGQPERWMRVYEDAYTLLYQRVGE